MWQYTNNGTVMLTLQNGQTTTRTGTSTSGWSRVEYNGQTLYCVSSYIYVVVEEAAEE